MSVSNANTLTQLQNDTNRIQFQNSRKNLGSDRLDRQGFIRLIMAQLQYQDPTEPQDSTQMLQQQLQLEQADQMQNLVSTNKFAQAGTMVGQTAELTDARWDFTTSTSSPAEVEYDQASGSFVQKSITGVIESVQFDRVHQKALIKIDGNYYDADLVRQLIDPSTANGGTPD